jgi:choice-of-anchor A domain-containing protein
MRLIRIGALTAATLWFAHATASADVLGVAGNYDAFSFTGIVLTDSTSTGALADGGIFTGTNVTVATQLNAGINLVVGGDMVINGGIVNGTAIDSGIDAGNTTINEGGTTGDVYASGDYGGDGGPLDGGTVYYGGYYGGLLSYNNQYDPSITLPFDFATEESELLNTSDCLSLKLDTGLTTVDPNGDLVFSSVDSGQNIFSVNASDLSAASNITVDIPSGATAIINVVNDDGFIALPDATFNFGGAQVIWNINDSTFLEGSSFSGSILAPTSYAQFTGGQVNGTLVANYIYATDEVLTIPSPASVWGGLLLLGGLGISRHVRRV